MTSMRGNTYFWHRPRGTVRPIKKAASQSVPSVKPVKLKNKYDSLLEVGTKEKAKISAYNLVNGFGQASVAPGVIEQTVAEYTTISATAAMGEVLGFLGVGVVGIVYGFYHGFYEIDEEQDKAIRINKELFLLFNLAADKRAAAELSRDKRDEDEYHEILRQIHIAVSAPSAECAVDDHEEMRDEKRQAEQKKSPKIPEEIWRMDAIIAEYAIHRETHQSEKNLWNQLRLKFNDKGKKHIDFFVNHSTLKQAEDYFKLHKNTRKDDFNNSFKRLLKILSEIEKDAKCRVYVSTFRQHILDIYGIVNGISRDAFESNREDDVRIKTYLSLATDSYNGMYLNFVPKNEKEREDKKDLRRIWGSQLEPLIREVDTYLRDLFSKQSKDIINQTNVIFGNADSSFRTFWRKTLPTKTYKYDDNEEIPVNFEQEIYRGNNVDVWQTAKAALFTCYGLFSTGKALLLLIGGTALASSVVGLVAAGAIALIMTGIGAYNYYQAKKVQNNRSALVEKLQARRTLLMNKNPLGLQASPTSPKTGSLQAADTLFRKSPQRMRVDKHGVDDASHERTVSDSELSISPESPLRSSPTLSRCLSGSLELS